MSLAIFSSRGSAMTVRLFFMLADSVTSFTLDMSKHVSENRATGSLTLISNLAYNRRKSWSKQSKPSVNFESSDGFAGCTATLKTGLDILSNGLNMSSDAELSFWSKMVAVLLINTSMSCPDINPIDPAGIPSTGIL
ncbi:hypothetical protein OGATHE_001156 [Ogataea polymorpha]|uniref:Uncharacterized protein n=1 Tax=Ogataea polymorpha TaxID=460523 RepID=A0A9P8PQX0_9ASCO|nr:hypothetical protein OGATHE_001156 [Ogataea polymorpha]